MAALQGNDPTPEVQALFLQLDQRYFEGKLREKGVTVRLSKRMTSFPSACNYTGGGGKCEIALSEPLLKLRPRVDLVQTILHEMIHAFLFVVEPDDDHIRDRHGPTFERHMQRINAAANLNISIHHNFQEEVLLFKTHWWRCSGPCRTRKPYFGILKRSYNRAPGPSDFWWKRHQKTCDGQFVKVKEPEKKQKPAPVHDMQVEENVLHTVRNHWANKDLNKTFLTPLSRNDKSKKRAAVEDIAGPSKIKLVSAGNPSTSSAGQNVMEDESDIDEAREHNPTGTMYPCPCCLAMVECVVMSQHIDECLNKID